MRAVQIADFAGADGVVPRSILDTNRKNRILLLTEAEFDAIATSGVVGDEVTDLGILSTSDTAGLGYATGSGGAVTQITSSSTGVTLSKPCGQITTVALTTAAAAEEVFVVTNTLVAATDVVAVSTTYAGGGTPIVSVKGVAAGSFSVVITNVHASAALDAVLVVNFAIIKAVAA